MQRKSRLILTTVLVASLLVGFMLVGALWLSAPVLASAGAPALAQADPAHGCDDDDGAPNAGMSNDDDCREPCDDAAVADGRGDDCDDPCDDAAVADGRGDDRCDDPCDDAAVADGRGDDCDDPCDDAAVADGRGDDCDDPCDDAAVADGRGDDCDDPCQDAAAAHGGDDDDCDTEDEYARIVSMPVTGTLGAWVIGANTYSVTEQTRLDEDYGAFAVDKCVEVEWAAAQPNVALEIETKPDYKCNRGDDNGSRFFGLVTGLPDDPALLGVWTVGTVTFTVNMTTELDTRHGDLVMGALVTVRFVEVEGEKVATKVRTIWSNPADEEDKWPRWRRANAFGVVESLPVTGTLGTWVIGGVPYAITEFTRLQENNGPLEAGAFVKVQYVRVPSGDRYAMKIQTTDDNAGGAPGEYRYIGVVDAKPTAFVGEWTISGATFVATDTTTFNEAHGLLIVGASVSVRYVITNDMRLATEIRTIVPAGAGDNHHVGRIERTGTSSVAEASVASADGKATNVWTVGGQDFVVHPGTLLDDELAALDVGGIAYVNAYAEADGSLVATSIEGMPANLQQFLPMLEN